MKTVLTRAGALALLAVAAPGVAQQATAPASTPIDTLEPAAAADAAAPAPTGDPVIDRLNALEAKVRALEERNRALADELDLSKTRLQSVEVKAAKSVQPGVTPLLSDPAGAFTFKARGVIDADFVHFNERRGGYDYDDGTGFRRARLGVDGTAWTVWQYRLEVDFAGNLVQIQDAYLAYTGVKHLNILLGQAKVPFGLESNNSDNFNTFIERGMFTNAFGNAGAERRLGLIVAYQRDDFTLSGAVSGDNEQITRATPAAGTLRAPDESIGANARVTWEPVSEPGRIVHVGASGFYRTNLRAGDVGDALRLTERPEIRVDNGNIIDTGVIPNVRHIYYGGVEGTVVRGPVSVTGEYGRLYLDRATGFSDEHFDGGYIYGSWFVTGESRPFRNGNFDRVRPNSNFSDKDGTGAIELAVRYDTVDVGSTPVAGRAGNKASSYSAGLNWYLTPNFKLYFNYLHFMGDNTPLDPIGDRTKADVFATRLHVDW